jgi:pimeloyl-ACP methyl ester carboxylesterase
MPRLRPGGGGTPHPAVPPPDGADRDRDGRQHRLDHAGPDQIAGSGEMERASHLGSMFAAIDCQPRWRERLGEITVPTLVVHGDEDPFFPHGNGVALAAEIPGATLLTLPGIRQGVPRVTWPDLVDALLRHTC